MRSDTSEVSGIVVYTQSSAMLYLILRIALVVLATAVGVGQPLSAQEHAEVVRGRVTTDSGTPIAGATVIVTRAPDRLSIPTETAADGAYTVLFTNGTGDYLVFVSAADRATSRVRVRRTGPDSVLVANVTLAVQSVESLQAVRVRATSVVRPARGMAFGGDIGALNSPVAGFTGSVTPEDAVSIASRIESVPGVVSTRDGASFLGLPSDQNSTTLNGMAFAGVTMPREAQARIRVGTSVYDPSRGDFSGAETSIDVGPGSWLSTNTVHITGTPPFSMGDPIAATARGYSFLGIDAGKSGESSPLGLFFRSAMDVSLRNSPLVSLNDASAQTLRYAGLSPDSVQRLRSIMLHLGIPPRAVPMHPDEQGSFILRLDRTPSAKVALNATGYIAMRRSTGLGASLMTAPTVTSRYQTVVAFAGLDRSEYFSRGFGLNETRLGINVTDSRQLPDVNMPSASVLVSSTLGDQQITSKRIGIGGSSLDTRIARSTRVELRNEATRTTSDGVHTIKATVAASYDFSALQQADNQRGTFTFNSLADLEQNSPDSYFQTVGSADATVGEWGSFVALGDLWKVSNRLQVLYGARIEANRIVAGPRFNPLILSQFGVRNDAVPSTIAASPRLGFRWAYSQDDGTDGDRVSPLGTFYAQGPLAVVRGGIGEFHSPISTDALAPAFSSTGLAGGPESLTCFGAAAPKPAWSAYQAGGATPSQCIAGTSPSLGLSASRVDLFDRAYKGPHSWRGNLAVTTELRSWVVSLDAVYSLNLTQPSLVDLNFRPDIKFFTTDESRPVYVTSAGITPSGAVVSSVESRKSPAFGTVTEHGSSARSTTSAFTLSLQPDFSSLGNSFVNLAYTLGHNRFRTNGFSAPTFSNPISIETARGDMDIRHQFLLEAGYRFPRGVTTSVTGRAYSGVPFTPVVGTDVNGDGLANDRAFIFDPAKSTNSDVAHAMSNLLRTTTTGNRDCLMRQFGHPAGRNSCEGPWTARLDVEISAPGKFLRLGRSTRITLAIANPLAGMDQLLHGANNLRGWGDAAVPDPILYTVRSYDVVKSHFVYDVNARFGTTNRTLSTSLAPFRVTLDISADLSKGYDEQQLVHSLKAVRRSSPGNTSSIEIVTSRYARTVPDPYELLLTFTDSLLLARSQEVALRQRDQRYRVAVDSIWRRLASTIVELPAHYNSSSVLADVVAATDAVWLLTKNEQAHVRAVLSPLQWQLAPGLIKLVLDPSSHIRLQPRD